MALPTSGQIFLNTEENKLIDKRFFLNTELKKRK